MADNAVIYYVASKGTIFECNLLTGTYWGLPSPPVLDARRAALTRAGVPFKDWGTNVADMRQFGVEIVFGADRQVTQLPGAISTAAGGNAAKLDKVLAALAAHAGGVGAPMVLVQASDSALGQVFAIGDRTCRWISRAQYDAGLKAKMWAPGWAVATYAEIKTLHDLVGEEQPLEPLVPKPTTYTVVAGDTFTSIATKLGVTVDALKAANPKVTDINKIAVGDVLTIPGK